MEEWIKEWLAKQRENGEKGLEVKKIGSNYYVYRSTTYWDKNLKKRRKRSIYLGKLTRDGIIKKTEPNITVKRYGCSQLLHSVMKDLIPLLEGFEHWKEIYALAVTRILGYVPLKRVKKIWEEFYIDIEANPSPKILSKVLKEVGLNREAQDMVFRGLMNHKHFVYDLSVVYTRSTLNLAEIGYNKDKIHLPQVNIALLYSMNGLPAMIKVIPGSVRDIYSLYTTVDEIRAIYGSEIVLVLDRGFFSDKSMDFLLSKDVSFVIPAKRNSRFYEIPIELSTHFFYRDRLIKAGKLLHGDYYIYLFEDVVLKAEEEISVYKKLDEGKISPDEIEESLKKAGRILLVSTLDLPPHEIYLMYKNRGDVEDAFNTYKNLLHADRMYIHNTETLFGHIFISFLSLYGYCKLQKLLREAGLLKKMSPMDLIEEFSKVYIVKIGNKEIITDIPKKVRELDKQLNLNLFPK